MLTLYRSALALRRDHPALGDGTMTWVDGGDAAGSDDVLAFRREPGLVCVVNVGAEPAVLPEAVRDGSLLLASDPLDADGRIPGVTSAWFTVD